MDEIQRVLVKEGRKDLAIAYYKKIAGSDGKVVARHSFSQIESTIKELCKRVLDKDVKKITWEKKPEIHKGGAWFGFEYTDANGDKDEGVLETALESKGLVVTVLV